MTCSVLHGGLKGLLVASLIGGLSSAAQASSDCLLRPFKQTRVSSDVSGVLWTLNVARGDQVVAGETLATLNTGIITARIERRQIDLAFNQREAARSRLAGAAVTEAENDKLTTAVQSAEAELNELQAELARLEIRAPHAGVIVDVLVNEGEQVSESHVLELADVDQLRVEANFDAADYSAIKAAGALRVTHDNGSVERAKIEFVEPVIDAASNTFRVTALLPAPANWLAGQSCRAEPSR